MGRRLLGVFMTVYMPTILINIIGHSTNYFSETYFEATITVNLTASTTSLNKSFWFTIIWLSTPQVMLVLTTMFVGVSNELPKTSYMKMVDYWLVFNLFIPFAEVLLHVYMVRKMWSLLVDFIKEKVNGEYYDIKINRINVGSTAENKVTSEQSYCSGILLISAVQQPY